MKINSRLSSHLDAIKKMGLCPSLLNLYSEKYSFSFLLNDIFSGIKIFLLLFPIAFSLAFFCGTSPVQGIIACAIASAISTILGGSKYQVSSIALPLCVVTFEILSTYQYKGLLFVAIFASLALILFGLLRMSDVLKHLSYAFIAALSIYVVFSIIINQAQYILDINTIHSSQGILENIDLFKNSMKNLTEWGLLTAVAFILPLIIIRMFFKSFFAFFVYIAIGCAVAYASDLGLLPSFIEIKTFGSDIASSQSPENILSIARTIPSQTFLTNTLSYAFVVALIIASEASFCTNVSSSLTGDRKLQTNMELISSGISNFVSVACGGLFVSPNTTFTLKNISFKSKTIISMITLAVIASLFVFFNSLIVKYIPVYCISSILIVYSMFEVLNKKLTQYFDIKSSDCCIFFATLIIAIYFGFIPAVIVGFIISNVFFSRRMVKINDAVVHTTRNHDSGAIEFMSNKNGFSTSQHIPTSILNKIEVIQISNTLFLNIAKVVEEGLAARGKFPSVLVVYFRNVPFLDSEALTSLKQLVKSAAKKECIVMVSGTNGMLLEILEQKAKEEGKSGDIFGYIVPNFKEAISKTVKRLNPS